jgi:serine protease
MSKLIYEYTGNLMIHFRYNNIIDAVSRLFFGFLISLFLIHVASAQSTQILPGYDNNIIQVRCHETDEPHGPEDLIPDEFKSAVQDVKPLFTLSREQLIDLKIQGEQISGKSLPSLHLWYEITLDPETDMDAFTKALVASHGISVVQPAPLPSPLPAITPDFTDLQGYLTPATNGINAIYAWNFPGGNGAGIKIYDLEYNWNLNHEDLSKVHGITPLLNADDVSAPLTDGNHGTAVLGELIADNDDKGVTGISWGADIGVAPVRTDSLGYNLANAILLSVLDGLLSGTPGVILIEQQTLVCGIEEGCNFDTQDGCGPSEWVQSVFDATQVATLLGFVVVAAAGNGDVDLDMEACEQRFDRNFRDSGAIIVGAGGAGEPGFADRRRLDFSSYGSRVDLQGWGERVMTTGYGGNPIYRNPDDEDDWDFWYTRSFGGTSSASPIVAGAVANLQGISWAVNSTLLSADQIRNILIDTGSPQLGITAQHIGPRPDLRFAIASIINVPPVADAGPDQTLECEGHDGTEVALDGSGSFDDNDDILTYTWYLEGDVIAGPTNEDMSTVTLTLGIHEVILEVDDGEYTDTDTVTITLEDTTPPDIAVHTEPAVLSPPNHRYHVIRLSDLDIEVSDMCDPDVSAADVRITEAWSDEEENASADDGNTLDDIIIGGTCDFVRLRAERIGEGGNGRVYTLKLEVADASGNVGTTTYDVHVPHDAAVSPVAVKDEPPLYVVTADHCAFETASIAQADDASASMLESFPEVQLPEAYGLRQNYPNPFNPSTRINYDLPEATRVTITVYDIMGREVARLVDGLMEAGSHSVVWNASYVANGVYFYRITTPEFVAIKSMTLLK